jgi:hypothetical protein
MKSTIVVAVCIVWVACSALAAEIASMPWNQANIDTLRAVDKTSVTTFLN